MDAYKSAGPEMIPPSKTLDYSAFILAYASSNYQAEGFIGCPLKYFDSKHEDKGVSTGAVVRK